MGRKSANRKKQQVEEVETLADDAEISVEADEVDDVLAEIDAEVAATTAASDEDVAAAAASAELDDAKAETYSKQTAEEEAAAATAAKATPAKPAKAKAATPRMSLETHAASEIITTRLGSTEHPLFQLDKSSKTDSATLSAAQASVLTTIDSLDKKSREKAINLFHSLNNDRKPSVYLTQAFDLLQKHKSVTMKDLVKHYLEDLGYKIGTARRQASQVFALFPVVAVATQDSEKGAPLVLNDTSVIGERISAVMKAATPAS